MSVIDSNPVMAASSDNPRADFIGDPRAGQFYHLVIVDDGRPGDAEAHLPCGSSGAALTPDTTFRLPE